MRRTRRPAFPPAGEAAVTRAPAYLGTQSDVWDAQKDMGLALCGALVAAASEWRVGGGPHGR